jgi:phosphatidylserine/phosphatidylglycerophosphate/cardiolipin synthase-like enzyme
VNGDDCLLAWIAPFTKSCWGFAIRRELKTASGQEKAGYIENRVGFADDNAGPHEHRPSNVWPFQRYTWTDHGVGEGDTVTYTVAPMLKAAAGLERDDANAATIGPLTITGSAAKTAHAYFNRGTLLSQFVASKLPKNFTTKDLTKLKKDLQKNDDELRGFLMGQLGARLIELLDEAVANKWHVYGALYELTDSALIGRLVALRKRAHLVLSNGSDKTGGDGNARAAKELSGVIDLHRRMLGNEGLGHNKFLVVARSVSDPMAVWTGSTNWATTGLCTQMNNAILIEDKALAGKYLDQWKRLRDDRPTGPPGHRVHFGPALLAANDQPKSGGGGQKGRWTVWFTRTTDGQDMEAAAKIIEHAQHAILFLMFEPGSAGLLQVVQARLSPASKTYKKGLYVHGVVNTLTAGHKNVAVNLVGRGQDRSFDLRVLEPEGVGGDLPNWAKEVTRRDFLKSKGGVIGHAIIHSKVLVIDPLTDPVVITGSHNFSRPATAANDENMLIVKGNKALAERYAVNIMSTYQHYRWRAYLQESARRGRSPWHNLVKGDTWQQKQPDHDQELLFWVH